MLIFPTSFSAKSISTLTSSIGKALEENRIKCRELSPDGSLLVADLDDPVRAAAVVADLFGVEKVAVARRAGNRFDELVDAIVKVGKRIINDGDTFAIRAVSSGRDGDYAGRDVEFAATASLTAELSKLNVRPAGEETCSKLIHAYISQRSAYACLFIDRGLGGLPPESQNEEMLCSLHNSLSAVSCLLVTRCGFRPRIALLRTDDESFRESARNLELIARRLGRKKMTIHVADACLEKGQMHPFLIEKISSMILARLSEICGIRNVALPLSVAIFPPWLISEIVGDTARTAAAATAPVPWLPMMMLMSGDLYGTASSMGLKDLEIRRAQDAMRASSDDHDEYAKLAKTVNIQDLVERAVRSMKTVDLYMGPNYYHEIIDLVAA